MVRPIFVSEVDEAKKSLKSFIITYQDGLDVNCAEAEWEWLHGEPFKLNGYKDISEFVDEVDEIQKIQNHHGQFVYIVQNNPATAHLQEMIKKQKPAAPRKGVKEVQITDSAEKRQARRDVTTETRRIRRHKSLNARRDINDASDESGRTSRASSRASSNYVPPIITSPPRNRRFVQTPVCAKGQLIGDDFLLQLAIRNLNQSIWREFRNGPLHCGLCVSGQTVRDCIKSLRNVDANGLSNRVVILLGAEDVYRGRESIFIQHDFEELLELLENKFGFGSKGITLCTVPPLGNLSWMTTPEQFTALRAFNHFIVEVAGIKGFGLLDFWSNFSTVQGTPNWELFQVEPRRVSGTPFSYLLFSDQGRRLGMTLLNSGSSEDYDE